MSRRRGPRGGRAARPQRRGLPEPRFDPFTLGVRQAEGGVPKTGSSTWVEAGHPASDWYRYSCGYDGAVRAAPPTPAW